MPDSESTSPLGPPPYGPPPPGPPPSKTPLNASMGASLPLQTDPSVSNSDSPIDSPVLIGGIAAAGAALLALIVWLSWVLLRSKRKRRSRALDAEGRKLPPDWVTAVEQFNRAKSPHSQGSHKAKPSAALASQFAFPHNAGAASKEGYAFTSPSASSSSSSVPPTRPAIPARHTPSPLRPQEVSKPKPLPHQSRPLSRDEFRILDHHTQTNTIPLPFARVQPGDVARIQAAVHNRSGSHSTTQSWRSQPPGLAQDPAQAAMSPPRKPFSIASSHQLYKHHSTAGSVASSFSFASMPYRGSTLGALQEDAASAVVPAGKLIQPGMHVVKFPFTALLPDEVNVAVEDRVTVVDVYDDGWCVVLKSGDDDVLMGAVPAWCFDERTSAEPEGAERTRPERKASLGVTVELEEPDTTGQSSRHDSVFSWSNF